MRPGTCHGRVDAVLPRLVAGRGHHRTIAHADDHRPAAVFRVPGHFQRRIESIHVDMQHRAPSLVMAPVTFGCCDSRCGTHDSMIAVFSRSFETNVRISQFILRRRRVDSCDFIRHAHAYSTDFSRYFNVLSSFFRDMVFCPQMDGIVTCCCVVKTVKQWSHA